MDPWPMIEADRRTLADYLGGLSSDDWETPSLCAGWSVADVVAHLLVVPMISKGKVLTGFIAAGFDLDRFSDKMVASIRADRSDDELARAVADTATSHNVPPGLKPIGVLSDLVVHAADIAAPLGKPVGLPVDHYVAAMEHLKGVQPALGCKKRIAGLELRATDADWSTGDGPLVEGSTLDLALAMTGRKAALDHLAGDGVEVLRGR